MTIFKKIITTFILINSIGSFWVQVTQAAIVTFPDVNLNSEVRNRLGIPSPTPITDTDMKTMTSLSAKSCGISNIQGLEYATNLVSLDLYHNKVCDIAPIAVLKKLKYLDMNNNSISDITAVSGMTNLIRLSLQYNNINDISAIAGLTNLNYLYVYNNNISNISAVSKLINLTHLSLWDNSISDISAITGLKSLRHLSLSRNDISDISPVVELTEHLNFLSLFSNNISDISAVAELVNLNTLDLGYNNINDISAINGLTNLYTLNLNCNSIDDVSPVAELTNLKYLYLTNNEINNISAFSGLTKLTWLYLDKNQIEVMDLSQASFTSLKEFDVEDNPLTKVLLTNTTLSQLTFDTLMNGGGSSYFNYTGIAELDGVLSLDMNEADFTDILCFSEMYTMDDLETLLLANATNIEGSEVVAMTSELDSLNWLDVTGLWDSFDVDSQNTLLAWDAIEGNTLVVPEPSTLSILIVLVTFAFMRKKRK